MPTTHTTPSARMRDSTANGAMKTEQPDHYRVRYNPTCTYYAFGIDYRPIVSTARDMSVLFELQPRMCAFPDRYSQEPQGKVVLLQS